MQNMASRLKKNARFLKPILSMKLTAAMCGMSLEVEFIVSNGRFDGSSQAASPATS